MYVGEREICVRQQWQSHRGTSRCRFGTRTTQSIPDGVGRRYLRRLIMTVGELKTKLEDYPDDYDVLVNYDDDMPCMNVDQVREGSLWNVILE